MVSLDQLNALDKPLAIKHFSLCCGSSKWVKAMIARRPFKDKKDLLDTGEHIWFSLSEEDWREAFSHHPKIGDPGSPVKGFEQTRSLPRHEQSGVVGAPREILSELSEGNRIYQEKFGYIFICFATGKTAREMLTFLKQRLGNDPETEISVASREQNKITRLRLEKLLDS